MAELCSDPGCYSFGRYCRIPGHMKKGNADQKDEAPVKRIARESPKRKELNKEYSMQSKPLWKDKPCVINSPDCTGWAQGWNHHAGKENKEKLMDLVNGEPACNACNTYCEANHKWAVQKGFRTKRNTQTKRYQNTYKK